jgi:holo-[acyl-carrier protein] synthase
MTQSADEQSEIQPVAGVDLQRVADVASSLARHGEAYLRRVYTSAEIAYARRSETELARRLAARFAAKEATLKVLQPRGHWLDWRLIEVTRNEHGHCGLRLHGEAARLAEQRGIRALSVSLSHEGELAVAVVFGLRRGNAGGTGNGTIRSQQ